MIGAPCCSCCILGLLCHTIIAHHIFYRHLILKFSTIHQMNSNSWLGLASLFVIWNTNRSFQKPLLKFFRFFWYDLKNRNESHETTWFDQNRSKPLKTRQHAFDPLQALILTPSDFLQIKSKKKNWETIKRGFWIDLMFHITQKEIKFCTQISKCTAASF